VSNWFHPEATDELIQALYAVDVTGPESAKNAILVVYGMVFLSIEPGNR
jgi:hypothetical protein